MGKEGYFLGGLVAPKIGAVQFRLGTKPDTMEA